MVFIDFRYIISQWSSIGVFDVLMPMILIFTIVFAILKKTKILGGIKGIDAIIALAISFFTISNPEISAFFMPLFSNVALGIIILISVMLMVGLFMGEKKIKGYYWLGWLGAIAIFFWILSRAFTFYGFFYSPEWLGENLIWIIPIILLIVAFGAIMSEKKPTADKSLLERFLEKED
jgi:hypothetical protein